MKNLLIIGFIVASFSAIAKKEPRPYKIVMIADSEAKAKAEAFREYLKTKPPFSKMLDKLQLDVVEMTKEELDCKNDKPNSPRIISCNNNLIRRKQRQMNADLPLVFTSNGVGGAGGDIPIASNDYPIQTMFHEMLHTFGLSDEYDYKPSERTVYCRSPRSTANIAYFKDTPPYENDSAARTKHRRDVPWMGGIPTSNPITNGSALGSNGEGDIVPGSQPLGLYRGGSCDSEALPGWRPYKNSIMKGYVDDTVYPLYEEIVVKNIEGSLGRRLNLPPPPQECLDQNFDFSKIQSLHNHVEEAIQHTH
jgi:hypothetical protein